MVLNKVFTCENDINLSTWLRTVEKFTDALDFNTSSVLREMGDPACEALNIFQEIVIEQGEFNPMKFVPRDWPISCDLDKESELLATFCLDIANSITNSNDGFLTDPEWSDPIPRSSKYLEDSISSY